MSGPGQEEFLPGFPTVDQFSQANLKKILMATKYSNELPADKKADWDYYQTFPGFRQVMGAQGDKIREIIKSQLNYHSIKANVDSGDIGDLVDVLCDANDALMERINMNLDEAAGIRKDVDPLLLEVSQSGLSRISGSWNKSHSHQQSAEPTNGDSGQVKLLAAKHVLRPQVKFKHLIDNSAKTAFIPRLQDKPHSLRPLSILVEYDDQGEEFYSHPYLFEIERFAPRPKQLVISVPVKPKGVADTELVYVDTLPALRIAVHELAMEEVIGVDVEHHSYRSYQGITCLVQISTQTKDFIIDPFNIWPDLDLLNEVTANPNIVKVLHGCDKDVEWLQRDFSVYLVNVFDSHQAGKILGLPRLSLAWLLHSYCGVSADKQFQLADWRIRPLPDQMVVYARQDTRYLPYLYQRMKNELISRGNDQNNLLHAVIVNSNNLCKKRYNKPLVWPDSAAQLVRKAKISFNNRQMVALKEVYDWRDKTARQEDESPGYVLPNHMMIKICGELPREMQGILACCNPVPPLIKQNLQVLHLIILNARDQTLSTPVNPEQDRNQSAPAATPAKQSGQDQVEFLENPLKSPLDLGPLSESTVGLETVLDKENGIIVNNNIIKEHPDLAVFSNRQKTQAGGRSGKDFLSPYKRYKLLKPYLDSINNKESDVAEERTDNVRLKSIQDHFQKLTDMTPTKKEEVVVEDVKEEDANDDAVVEVSDEDENVPVQNLRKGFAKEFKKHKQLRKAQVAAENLDHHGDVKEEKRKKGKRMSDETFGDQSKIPKLDKGDREEFDYKTVDFSALQKASTKYEDKNDFNPNKKEHDKKNKKGMKQKQKWRGGGKSSTFARK